MTGYRPYDNVLINKKILANFYLKCVAQRTNVCYNGTVNVRSFATKGGCIVDSISKSKKDLPIIPIHIKSKDIYIIKTKKAIYINKNSKRKQLV